MPEIKFERLVPIVVTIMTAMVLLAAGLIISDKLLEQSQTTASTTINNLTFDLTPSTFTIPEASYPYFKSMDTSVRVVNGTDGSYFLVAEGNYTTSSAGTIVASSIYTANYTDANITYTYHYSQSSAISSDINASITGIGDFGADWIGIIIIVVIAAIIIGLIIGLMPRRRT